MTVSDLFAVPATATQPEIVDREGACTRARVRARISDTDSDGNVLTRIGSTVVSDFTAAWLWDAEGITIRALWEQRVPALERVPADNRGLHVLWTVYNHVALIVLAPLLFLAWVLSHPARLLYTAPVAAPLISLWLL